MTCLRESRRGGGGQISQTRKAKTQKTVRAQRKGIKRIESWGSQCCQQGVLLPFGSGNMCPRTRDVTEVGELIQRVWRTTTVLFFWTENMKHFSKDSMGAGTLPHRVSQILTAWRIYNLIRKSNGVIICEQIVLQSGRRLHRSSLLFPGSWEDNGADKRRGGTPETC